MRLSTPLTKAGRTARDVEAVERTLPRGDVGYVATRTKNQLVGRALARTGMFRAIWGPWGRQ